jgi:hypothetical protein
MFYLQIFRIIFADRVRHRLELFLKTAPTTFRGVCLIETFYRRSGLANCDKNVWAIVNDGRIYQSAI